MKRRAFLAGLAAAITVAGVSADARMHAPYRAHRIVSSVLPLDGTDSFATPSGAYSFRKLKSTYVGPAIRIRRASDNNELDINFLGCTSFTGCPWDSAAANAHCAATTCFARTWYDQSGLARDVGEAVPANQPQLIFNCNGSLPCIRTTAQLALQTVAQYTPVPPTSYSAVANRSAGTGPCYWPMQYPGNSLSSGNASANNWLLFSTGSISVTAADNAWHSGVGVMAGAASVVRLDGVETTGTVTASTTLGTLIALWGAPSTTCNVAEVIAWNNYALTPAERAVLGSNQKSYWGTP